MQKAFTTESTTAAVVKIILEESGAGDVVVRNSRILNVFQKKISVLQKAYWHASKAEEENHW